MSAGTITLTNGSAIVGGNGTSFTTELAAGDFIVSTVGGVPYTLPVKSVENNTQLTLVSNFTGPTQSGAAWSAVPRVALNMVTAALVAQSAEALRGLNYDKQNWQNIFSGTGVVTVTLPDGSTWTGPAWNGIAAELNKKVNSSSLGSSAYKNTGIASGNVMEVGAFGIGESAELLSDADLGTAKSGSRFFMNGGGGFWSQWGCGVKLAYFDTHNFQIYLSGSNGSIIGMVKNQLSGEVIFATHYSNSNTTIDANGNLKPASPVVKLKGNGTAELNHEAEGVIVKRIDKGIYRISGVLGFNSDPIWGGTDGGLVIPNNRNGLPLLWVDYEIVEDGSIILKTYHRTHNSAPVFASNHIEGVNDGEPIDIPDGRWIDLRVEMPQRSIWNQKQEATRIAMEEARMKEERTDGNNV
ncbi:phage tail protein [Salmonella enterica]|uniref:Phage tail protein n=1 Tax=Salmonella enterica subsp. arizonae serovar 48:z4,z24:- TaxID=1967584 RepID=A0A738XAD0_SALER|nr:phage tail protein [Salmonella enterica]EDR1779570.1 phage tail protein [Salmonella enterica subsp. arizonae]EDU0937348.1 phage tail protein [Salmonella enterica subsp. arizonae serovar 48:z4,z24:-]EDX3027212.1 phage tail protein [Salmonella enterica subsp. houtenae serovar 48:g,z51:-]EAR4677109.1 phage tail protein [Salmonella enterica]